MAITAHHHPWTARPAPATTIHELRWCPITTSMNGDKVPSPHQKMVTRAQQPPSMNDNERPQPPSTKGDERPPPPSMNCVECLPPLPTNEDEHPPPPSTNGRNHHHLQQQGPSTTVNEWQPGSATTTTYNEGPVAVNEQRQALTTR